MRSGNPELYHADMNSYKKQTNVENFIKHLDFYILGESHSNTNLKIHKKKHWKKYHS